MRQLLTMKSPSRQIYALFILSTLPAFMFLFNKSAAAILVATAILACGRHVWKDVERYFVFISHKLRAKQADDIGVMSLVIYTVVSTLWSPDPIRSANILAGVVIVLLAVKLTERLADADQNAKIKSFAFHIVVICAVAVMIEEAAGMKLHQIVGVRSESFALKRTVLCSTILFLALAGFAVRRFGPLVTIVAGLLQAGAITAAHSGAAAFGVIGFCVAMACHRFGGARAAKAISVAWIAGCLALAPLLGALADHSRNGLLVKSLQAFHLRERIEIWSSFGELVQEKPLFGYGFGSSQAIVGRLATHVGFDPTLEVIRELHPHNAYLQIWVEFGFVGVVAALVVMLRLIRSLDETDADFRTRLGLTMFCCFVMLLSHSLWQPWWIASIAAGIIWLRVSERPQNAPHSDAWSSPARPAG